MKKRIYLGGVLLVGNVEKLSTNANIPYSVSCRGEYVSTKTKKGKPLVVFTPRKEGNFRLVVEKKKDISASIIGIEFPLIKNTGNRLHYVYAEGFNARFESIIPWKKSVVTIEEIPKKMTLIKGSIILTFN